MQHTFAGKSVRFEKIKKSGFMVFPVAAALAMAPMARANPVVSSAAQPLTASTAEPLAGHPHTRDLSHLPPLKPVADALKHLNRQGVHVRAQVVEEPAMNVRGGVSHGKTIAGQFQFGVDLDLKKLLDIDGAKFHVTVFRDTGYSLSAEHVGVNYSTQEIYKNPYERIHFGVFAYEQNFFHDRFNWVFGRLGTTSYFARLPELCNFLNGAVCGIPTVLKSESGLVLPPSSTWGTRLLFHSTPHLDFSLGANEINPTASPSNGLHWGLENKTGHSVEFETGYHHDLHETPYPYQIKVGVVHSQAPHANPYFNTAGESLALYGGKPRQKRNRGSVYMVADKTIWRSASRPSNISIFGTYTRETDKEEIYGSQNAAGMIWTGPFPHRPIDKLSFEVFDLTLTPLERAFLHDSRVKAGGSGWNASHEYELDASYNYAILPGLRVMPDVQYIVHPDNSKLPHTRKVPNNALVVGVQLVINIGSLLGAPSALVQ